MYFFADEFESVIKKTTFFNKIKFNFETEFVKTYFGSDKKAHVRFDDFSHLLQVCDISFFSQIKLLCESVSALFDLGEAGALTLDCAVFLGKNLVIHFLHETIYVLF